MKRCPQCGREYDSSMMFCLDDGTELLYGPGSENDPATAILSEFGVPPSGGSALEAEPPTVLGSSTERQNLSAHRAGQSRESGSHGVAQTLGSGSHPTEQLRGGGSRPTFAPQDTGSRSFERQERTGFNRPLLAALVLAIIALAGFFGYRYFKPAVAEQISSIAVLPFENRSGNSDTDYLSDGLAESLIYRLTQLPNLKVSPTSSVFRYKGSQADVAQIAKELDVDAVMSGRLAQRGDDLTISVELIDARTKKLIWAEQYDRKMSDLLATQREIATTITQKLQLKLAGDETKGITKKYTDSNEAYQLYLRGRYHWNKRTPADLKKSIDYFQQAIDKDPTYALAYGAMAEGYILIPGFGIGTQDEYYAKARAAAMKAIEIDDSLAEAHNAIAAVLKGHDWKFPEAEAEWRKAIEINPNYASAHQWYGEFLSSMGRDREALAEMRRAQELDPLSLIINGMLAMALA